MSTSEDLSLKMDYQQKNDSRNKDNKGIRLQMSPTTKAVLTEIAKQYQCTYGRKKQPSISGLLKQIGDQELIVVKSPFFKNKLDKFNLNNIPLIQVQITVLSNLDGLINLVIEKVASLNGNIYKIFARENEDIAIICMKLPENCNLSTLAKNLKEIKIKDVINFNRIEKKEKLLRHLDADTESMYRTLKKSSSTINTTLEILDKTLKEKEDEPLIIDVLFSIRLRFFILNKPGTLSEITKTIAEHKISIIQLYVNTYSEEKNCVDLVIGIYPDQAIKDSISNLKKNLEKITTLNDNEEKKIIIGKIEERNISQSENLLDFIDYEYSDSNDL